MHLKAVIFDFDGIILDTETPWYRAYADVFREEGVELPLGLWAQGIGTSFEHEPIFALLAEGTGRDVDAEAIRRRAFERYKRLTETLPVLPGVEALMADARRLGLKIGLASSSDRPWVEGFLRKCGLFDFFDAISTMEDVERVKPAPDLYVRTLNLLGVAAEEAFAIEDSLNGLNAALAAGLRCVVVPNEVTKHLPFAGETLRLSSLADMPLESLIARLEAAEGRGGGPMIGKMAGDDRLASQLAFIREIDRLKNVLRQSLVTDRSRRENAAEHSWHLAMMATVLREHACESGLDADRVIRMLLVHDIVEIDAGDTFAYDEAGHADKAEREKRAARRLFSLLPDDQRAELEALWSEFEERKTPEAKFANALDRLQPMIHNYLTEGHTWKKHGVTARKVRERNAVIAEGSPALWRFAERLIDSAVKKGYLEP
jgi:putative hydrolase of HD superfamily